VTDFQTYRICVSWNIWSWPALTEFLTSYDNIQATNNGQHLFCLDWAMLAGLLDDFDWLYSHLSSLLHL